MRLFEVLTSKTRRLFTSNSREEVEDLGEIQDLTQYEQPPRSLAQFVHDADALSAPKPRPGFGWLWKAAVGVAGAAMTLVSGMYFAGFRIWSIAPPDATFDIPFQTDGSGDAYVCFIHGTEDKLLVDGRTGARSSGNPEPVELKKNFLFFTGDCRDFVPFDGNAHIRLYFRAQNADGINLNGVASGTCRIPVPTGKFCQRATQLRGQHVEDSLEGHAYSLYKQTRTPRLRR